jgi:hypothetical protein
MRIKSSSGVLAFILLLLSLTTYAQFQSPRIKWDKTTHEFGKVKLKSPVSYEFEFTNEGEAPLLISDVEPSCGCTVTEYSKDPILPGKKGKIKTTFDATSLGKFNKSIKIVANLEGGPEYLYVRGTVVP